MARYIKATSLTPLTFGSIWPNTIGRNNVGQGGQATTITGTGFRAGKIQVSVQHCGVLNVSVVTTTTLTCTLTTSNQANGVLCDVTLYETDTKRHAYGYDVLTIQDPDTTPPAAPTGLTATAGDTSVVLDWSDNAESDLDHYGIYRRNADTSWPSTPTALSTTSDYTDTGRTNGTAYTYRVTAFDTTGNESSASSTASATPTGTPDPEPGALTATSGRPFASSSPFNMPIPAAPVLDPNNAAMVGYLNSGVSRVDIIEYGCPVWDAYTATPRKTITVVDPYGIGFAPFAATGGQVPLTSAMTPATGTDKAMVVVEYDEGYSYEFYDYRWNNGSPSCEWGARVPLNGSGTPVTYRADSSSQNTQWTSNPHWVGPLGYGGSRLAGVIRLFEMQQGHIDHALCVVLRGALEGVIRWPAQKTDATTAKNFAGSAGTPQAARIQLNMTDAQIDALSITSGEKIIGKALAKYGAYAIDCGGGSGDRMFFICDKEDFSPYGLYDYTAIRLPWQNLRVLRKWDGT